MANFFQAWIIFFLVTISSCKPSGNGSENIDLAVNFLGIKDINNYTINEKGNNVILNNNETDERFICTLSDSNYVKSYKYYISEDDSFKMSFHNDSTLINDYNLNVLRTNPSVSNWPTDSVIEFFFPKIPFGQKTLLLNYKDAKGKSTTIKSVKIINGKCSLKIPFSDLEEHGFGLSYKFKTKYYKYITMREWLFGNVILK
ncbi:MAG: hypothetical protein JXQ87_06840 [Bacteroidia bacterium]